MIADIRRRFSQVVTMLELALGLEARGLLFSDGKTYESAIMTVVVEESRIPQCLK